jgi:hypothetical protein
MPQGGGKASFRLLSTFLSVRLTKMKVPVEDREKFLIACVLMAVALLLAGRWVIGWDLSRVPVFGMVTPAAVTHDKTVRPISGAGQNADRLRSIGRGLRTGDLLATESSHYEGSGRDIFRVLVEIPPARTPPEREEQRPDPPKVFSLPPIPLKFFGFTRMHGTRRIFLSKDEDVFIASEGDIVDRRYRIVRIAPSSVEVEDMLNSHRGRILLTGSGT